MAKVKIIKELPPKFKEIKKEEEEEENLEEEVSEESQEETFSDFIEGERTAPVLEPIPIPDTESLEQELTGVASTSTTARAGNITNIPDYGTDYEQAIRYEEIERQERRDREINVTFAGPRTQSEDEFKKMDVRGWREGMIDSSERDRQIQRDYEKLIMKKEGEREGLPFEDKKSRRRLNI